MNDPHHIKFPVSDFGDKICVRSRRSGRGYAQNLNPESLKAKTLQVLPLEVQIEG